MSSKGYNSSYRGSNNPGAFYHVPASAWGGDLEPAMPAVSANSTAILDVVVPNTSSQWKVQKTVDYSRPDGTQETAGISIGGVDLISPEYPGAGQDVTSDSNTWFVMNGYLFLCTTSGTTASAFIGFPAFNKTFGATTTDGTAVWTSYGKAALIRVVFSNSTADSATPVAQEYDFFQF